MPFLANLLDSLLSASVDVAALAVLLIFILPFILLTIRAKSGRRFPLRHIAAYERLQSLVGQATESGRPLHIALGSGRIGSASTPEAAMGLTVFDYVARYASAPGQPLLGTTADATILATAQGILQSARREAGYAEHYSGREICFSGPDPIAYAINSLNTQQYDRCLATAYIGQFGAEGLWLAARSDEAGLAQIGGTSNPPAMALLWGVVDEPLIGEEIYAAGAYLHRPSHLGSLATQDVVRVVTILTIIIGVVLASLGYWR
jgi:hypothetical protein